ncbi:MAG: RNA 2',3'-cyclic phosphodiesterase [Acidaminococcaceae bacterium]
MRLFIAVEFEKEVIAALCSLHDELRASAHKVQFVPSQNLHLTLFFLGNTTENKLAEISKALQSIGENYSPFMLELNNRLETFDARNPARVVWVGVKSDLSALQKLQAMIAAAMHNIGFLRTEKTYIPHITVARDVHFNNTSARYDGNTIEQKSILMPSMLVKEFSLISSILVPESGKHVYKTLATFSLKYEEK